jgi:AraC-like DNA-binding protein
MYSIQIIRTHFRHVKHWQPVSCRHYWRLYFNKTGQAKVNDVVLNPDILVGIPPSMQVAQNHSEAFDQFYIHFSVDEPFDQNDKLIILKIKPDDLLLLEDLISERIQNQDKSKLPLNDTINMKQYHLITKLLSHVKIDDAIFKDSRINEAVKILKSSLADPLSNQQLAKQFSLSVNGFSKLFKDNTGITPHQYLLKLKVKKAAELLSDNTLSIEGIAEQCGFYDRAHFSRLFTKEYNMAPAKYRKEISNTA